MKTPLIFTVFLTISIFIFSCSDKDLKLCPIEDGEIQANLVRAVSGAGPHFNANVRIKACTSDKVISISNGIVKVISNRKIISVRDNETVYFYHYLDCYYESGSKISKGSILGELNSDFFVLKVMKNKKTVFARDYIACGQ